MKVYLLKDVESVGLAGQVVNVSDGYAANFLIPRKLGKKVDQKAEGFFAEKSKKVEVAKQALNSKMSMLAEKIKNLKLTVKERVHDDGKLYGSVGADEVVELLASKDIQINRKQVTFGKAVRSVGEHKVGVKLSSKLKPEFTLTVVAE